MTAGIYSLCDFEVTPSAIIGFLTILSYSLYDTVVVFDKIRENTADLRTDQAHLRASRSTWPSTRPWSARSTPPSWRSCRSPRSCSSARSCWAPVRCSDLSLALFVGIIVGAAATIFFAAPMYALAAREGTRAGQQPQSKRVRELQAASAPTAG